MTPLAARDLESLDRSLPVHALYLYHGAAQLAGGVLEIIERGLARREKVIYVGGPPTCTVVHEHFRNRVQTVTKGVTARSLAAWTRRAQRKLSRTNPGLRMIVECGREHLRHEPALETLSQTPGSRIFLLCMYDIGQVSTVELMELLKVHPYVFAEHLIQPNCFYSRVRRQDWIDTLTGVFDRAYFTRQLETELQRASRYEHNLSLLLMDVDRLRKVNKDFGTPAGDQVLQQLARILERNLRSMDILARYGGDEFVALLPETKKAYAQKTAQRIMRNVHDHDFFEDNLSVRELSLTIGVAGFPEDAGDARQMIKKAQDALRRGKRAAGRTAR